MKRLRRALLFAGWFAPLVLPAVLAQAPVKGVADYQVGDTALSNIVTRVELVVIDREASAALRKEEAQKIPAVVRFNPRAAENALGRLRETFSRTRDQFVVELAGRFGKRQLSPDEVNSPAFREFRTAFQAANNGFPVTQKLATTWAEGGDGEEVRQRAVALLQDAVGKRLRPDEWPVDVREGPVRVRVLTLEPGAPAPGPGDIEKLAPVVNRAAITAVGKARAAVQRRQQPASERNLGRFLAGLIEANCEVDEELTRRLRAAKTADLWSADRYAAGEVLVRAGEPVTRKVKAALDELASKTAVVELRQTAWRPWRYWPLLLISLSTGLVVAGLIVFILSRRLEPRMDAILVQTSAALPAGAPRALIGEGAAALTAAAREAARPHLENALKDKLVTELLSQRKDLIETQRQAEADLAALEDRLEQLHAPLQARLDAYETRIGELERDLTSRGDENAELINATIALMKQKLEAEKSGRRVTLMN